MFRQAEHRDAEALAGLLNQAMSPGQNVTARLVAATPDDRIAWLDSLRPPFGAWVYDKPESGVVAFSALVPFAVRPRLPGIAEISLYVDERARSGLLAARLLVLTVNEARRGGIRSLVSIASDQNVQSLSGSVAYGFRQTATLREVGRVDGKLASATWLQKDLQQDDPPQYRKLRDSMLRAAGVQRAHAADLGPLSRGACRSS